ncbi:MAG: tRNA (N6-isopentenyl adenosine(37)-C2)-methylthiotransferase MiaB [Thermoanaerobaculia bacterium]
MGKTYFIETWGCQMNDLDSQRFAGQLRLRGYTPVENETDADLILLNTCSIRDKSEQKVYGRLGAIREQKSRGAMIGVCGCVAQQEGEALLKRAPYVDFVLGPGNIGNLDRVLNGETRLALDFPEERNWDYLAVDRPSKVRAQITVIEGCNKNCTFCIVPTTRGREISRPMRDILTEVRYETGKGRVEIELLGQTVNAYRCPESGAGFAELLEAVAEIPDVLRLRFVTSHPAEVTPRMIEVMRDHPNICRFLHLPVQSGSSAVLRRMKRLYTRERYLELIHEIRREIPEMHFSTDFIVGFPGETDEDLEATLSLMRIVRFGSIFAFKYSPRPGTPALRLPNVVSDEIASARLTKVFELQEEIEREALRSLVGKVIPVLYEGPSRNDQRMLSGRSDQKWTVNFRGDSSVPVGTMFQVQIEEALHHSLRGEAIR